MNTIDKIRAEIERQIKDPLEHCYGISSVNKLRELLDFLDTLESEKPTNQEGLEEEIDRFEDWMETYNQADYPTSFTTRDIARHFAKWGAEHASGSSEIPNDLEEAAEGYGKKKHPMTITGAKESKEDFIAGAKWNSEQMLKEAVEHYVIGEIAGSPVGPAIVHYDDNLTIGDKVRIIILPKEE